jgi:hypothetical protein
MMLFSAKLVNIEGLEGMFYRIMMAPPGYAPHEKHMVAQYTTQEFGSCCGGVKDRYGTSFFATLGEARNVNPCGAKQLPFEPESQFLELWKVADTGHFRSEGLYAPPKSNRIEEVNIRPTCLAASLAAGTGQRHVLKADRWTRHKWTRNSYE